MKILADRGKCEGYGNCAVAEPEVFDLDEEGFVRLLVEDVAEDLRDGVREAVRDCPVRALGVEE